MVFLEVDEVRLIATAMWPGLPDPDQDGKIVAVGSQTNRDRVLTAVGSGARWGGS
jgi:hypothetical protein